MPSNCTIISWKGKKEMASLLKGSKGGAFQYSRRGLRLRRRGAYGIHRASGPRCQGLCRKVVSLRSGGRRLTVRIAMEHPISAMPCTPFASSRRSPQGETRDLRRKTESHIFHVPFRSFPPLVAIAVMFIMSYDKEKQIP